MTVLIVKNITREGPGMLEHVLTSHSVPYKIVDLSMGDSFPSPEAYSAVVVLGGPDSANDETPKMKEELKRIRETLDAGIPYLGICLGMQTLTKAAGGKVLKCPVKEIGWRGPDRDFFTIEPTEHGKQDAIFHNLETPINIFHLHGETVELPPEMLLLASGKHCKNQIVKLGKNAYGIQGHFELTGRMLKDWLQFDPDLKCLDREMLLKDYNLIEDKYQKTGKQIFTNFLRIAGLI